MSHASTHFGKSIFKSSQPSDGGAICFGIRSLDELQIADDRVSIWSHDYIY